MKNNPGCPCCEDCTLYADTFDSLAIWQSLWDVRAGSVGDVSVADHELSIAGISFRATSKHLHPNPAAPYSMKISCSVWGEGGSTPRLFVAWDSGEYLAVELTIGDPGVGPGYLRVYYFDGTTEAEIGNVIASAALLKETWVPVTACWDGDGHDLTVTVAGNRWTWHQHMDGGPRWGLGTGGGPGTSKFKSFKVDGVGLTYTNVSGGEVGGECYLQITNGETEQTDAWRCYHRLEFIGTFTMGGASVSFGELGALYLSKNPSGLSTTAADIQSYLLAAFTNVPTTDWDVFVTGADGGPFLITFESVEESPNPPEIPPFTLLSESYWQCGGGSYYQYGEHIHCPECSTSCDIVPRGDLSEFTTIVWDAAGYTFSGGGNVGTAIGTGLIRHKTLLEEAPYHVVLELDSIAAGCTYEIRFGSYNAIRVISHVVSPGNYTIEILRSDPVLTWKSLSTLTTVLFSSGQTPDRTVRRIRIESCVFDELFTVLVSELYAGTPITLLEWKGDTDAVTFSPSQQVEAWTDDTDCTIRNLSAQKVRQLGNSCPSCPTDCSSCDEDCPPSLICEVEISGLTPNNQYNYVPTELMQVWPLEFYANSNYIIPPNYEWVYCGWKGGGTGTGWYGILTLDLLPFSLLSPYAFYSSPAGFAYWLAIDFYTTSPLGTNHVTALYESDVIEYEDGKLKIDCTQFPVTLHKRQAASTLPITFPDTLTLYG